MNHIPGSGCAFWLDLTPEQRVILTDRARKHKALLHNQPIDIGQMNRHTGFYDEADVDTRVEESEVILDQLLRRYSCILPDEQIEEIAAVDKDEAALNVIEPYLSITTNLQTIELPYES